jgi:hypothetical protein
LTTQEQKQPTSSLEGVQDDETYLNAVTGGSNLGSSTSQPPRDPASIKISVKPGVTRDKIQDAIGAIEKIGEKGRKSVVAKLEPRYTHIKVFPLPK